MASNGWLGRHQRLGKSGHYRARHQAQGEGLESIHPAINAGEPARKQPRQARLGHGPGRPAAPLGKGVDGDAALVKIAEEARVAGAGRQATDHHPLVLQFHGQGLGKIQHIGLGRPIGGEIGGGLVGGGGGNIENPALAALSHPSAITLAEFTKAHDIELQHAGNLGRTQDAVLAVKSNAGIVNQVIDSAIAFPSEFTQP